MSTRFAEFLAGSFNRFVLLIAQVNKLKSAVDHGVGDGPEELALYSA
jgi:hypothetical protein